MSVSQRGPAQRAPASHRRLGAAQRWLLQRVTRPLESTRTEPSDDARWVKSGDGWSGSDRVAVYQRAYFSRLVECLRDDYPAVQHAAGPVDFEALCLEFIEAHPPESASLNFYGAPFADFCATSHAARAAFMSELARLEWAMVECIHADARGMLDPATLAACSEEEWPRVRLVPSPTCRILTASFPVHTYYRAFLRDEEPEPPAFGPSTIAVSRRGDDVWRMGIDPRFAGLLARLVRSEPLAGALQAMALETEDASSAAELQRALSEWVSCGLFAGVRVD